MSQQYASTQPQGSSNYIRNVAIVGAAGLQGTHIVKSLLETGKHIVTALTREESSATFPSDVKVARIDYSNPDTLVSALQGQDALVITMNVAAPSDTSFKLIEAASAAGVKWVIPNEWGVDTTNNIEFGKAVFLGPPARACQKLIQDLGVSSWTGIACGFWYQYSLGSTKFSYGFDFKEKEVTFYDDGEQKISMSTCDNVGKAVARLLSMKIHPDDGADKSPSLDKDFKNKLAYLADFCVSQKDIFESVKRVTGTTDADWSIKYEKAEDRVKKGLAEMSNGNRLGYLKLLYARSFYKGNDADFESKYELSNKALGLPKKDLDECTRGAIKLAQEKQGATIPVV